DTLTLSGMNSFTGGLTVDAGKVTASSESLGYGDIAIAGTAMLEIHQHDISTSFGGSLTGSGMLTKSGEKILLLSGDSKAYTGHTDVTGGTLLVGDSMDGDASTGGLGGTMTVFGGATLGGSGQVGGTGLLTAIQDDATLAPGNSIGHLTIV